MAKAPIRDRQVLNSNRTFRSTKLRNNTNSIKRKIRFSRTEIKHLGIGTLMVSLVALNSKLGNAQFLNPNWISLTLTLLFTSSFLLHEMAHKFTAQKYELWSEFRIDLFGAFLTLLSIFSPWKLIAPGTVIISGKYNRSTLGITAFAGPFTNILLGYVFLFTSVLISNGIVSEILALSAYVNGILAAFNLIPFGVLDGQKIIFWNPKIWGSAVALSIALLVLAIFL
jgi:Zn-dependent protease